VTSASIPALWGHPTNLLLKLLQQRECFQNGKQVVINIASSHTLSLAGLTVSQMNQRGEELGVPADRYLSCIFGSRLHHLETGIQSLASDANYCTLRLNSKISLPRSPFKNLPRIRIKFGRAGKFHIVFSSLGRMFRCVCIHTNLARTTINIFSHPSAK